MNILRLGSQGDDVKKLQEILEQQVDGYFGADTEDAVIEFQKLNGLTADGIVGSITWECLLASNDTSIVKDSSFIDYMLTQGKYGPNEKGEMVWIPNYWKGPFKKQWLVFHHTAGGPSPYQTIDIWEKDAKTVATEFVVGGDGTTLRCIPEGSWGAHLTIGNTQLHRESIGVEICNYGGLTKGGYYTVQNKKQVWVAKDANKFYNAYGTLMDNSVVFDLGWTYRYHQYFHKYTDSQIEACKVICEHARDTYKIDINGGLKELINEGGVKKAFEFILPYVNANPGVYTHGNVFEGKNDIYPDPRFIDMLMTL